MRRRREPFCTRIQTAEIFCEGERVGYLGKLSYEIQDELDMRVPAYVMEIDLAALKKWYGKEQIFTRFRSLRRKSAILRLW